MDVLLIAHGLPPESVGGVEQHVEGLAAALVRSGCRVAVYARTGAPGRPQGELVRQRSGNPEVTRVVYRYEGVQALDDTYEYPPLDAAFQRYLSRQAEAGWNFAVAHVHHLTGLSAGVLRVLRDSGIPTVLTLHDYWLMCPRGQMWHRRGELCQVVETDRCAQCLALTFPHWLGGVDARPTVQRLHERARRWLTTPDRLVAPSARALPPFQAMGLDPSRIQVVENGVDTRSLAPLPPADPGSGPLRLGYLGTLIPSKGLHVLVEALQRLPAGTAELRIHGNAVPYHGDEGYLTRVFGSLRPGDPVTYHGPYSTSELPAILRDLDLVAAPALWNEAFGLTVREALAAGRPVLVSRIGGLQDAVSDGVAGRVLPPADVGAWAAAIAELAQDRKRLRQMTAAARDQPSRGFDAMAEDLLAIYRELAELDRRGAAP